MALDESRFHAIADQTLSGLLTDVEDTAGDVLDIDEQGGILTIELDSGAQYIVNKNAPLRQIWLSSPQSGAWHFDWDGETWVSTRHDGTTLTGLLAEELTAAVGLTVSL